MASLKELLAAKNAAKRAPATAPATAVNFEVAEKMPLTGNDDILSPRELASKEKGQNIPDEWPGDGTEDYFWKQCYTAFSSDLRIVVEPPPSCHAWIAVVRTEKNARPLLLTRLPLANGFNPRDPF